jgi:hypothetical protein
MSGSPTAPTAASAVPAQRRVWHFLEMLLAMAVGMLVLPPVEDLFFSVPAGAADLHLLVMAANMSAGMLVWMLVRRHSWSRIVVMVAAMWAPTLALAVPYHLDALDGTTLIAAGHVLMLPCMFLALRAR